MRVERAADMCVFEGEKNFEKDHQGEAEEENWAKTWHKTKSGVQEVLPHVSHPIPLNPAQLTLKQHGG